MITPLFIAGLGMQDIFLILLIVLLFFGGKKIPELMKGLGKGVKSFKDGKSGIVLESYIGTMMMLNLMIGIIFEILVVACPSKKRELIKL